MATENSGIVTHIANTDVEAYRAAMLLSTDKVGYPTAVSHRVYGTFMHAAKAGEPVAVMLINAPGTRKVQLGNDAVTAADRGVPLYLAAANGLFVDTDPGSGVVWFIAIQSCDASGVVEAYPAKLS